MSLFGAGKSERGLRLKMESALMGIGVGVIQREDGLLGQGGRLCEYESKIVHGELIVSEGKRDNLESCFPKQRMFCGQNLRAT